MSKLKEKYLRQPLIINTVVANGIAAAMSFGVDMSASQMRGTYIVVNTINLVINWFLVSPEYTDD